MVTLTIGAEEITSTDCHPFWVVRGEALDCRPEPEHAPAKEFGSRQEGRWVVARDLRVGDELLLHTGETMAIEQIAVSTQRLTVYNVCVAWLKNYAVGCSEVLAHNQNGPAEAPAGYNPERGRSGAFREAKRDLGIPRGAQPESVRTVPMTDRFGRRILDANGRPVMTREYIFTRPDGSRVIIQDHSAGHPQWGIGPHFNVRPIENPRTGQVPGTQPHYPFER